MQARILIVDDEESIRFTFENLLNDNGYLAESARDFDSALAMIQKGSFDLIFSDIFLGGKTGIDILREIRKTDGRPQFVFMTGHPHMETALEAVRLGAFDYIPKPFKSETILRVARMALQHKALTDEKERYRSNLEAIFRSVNDAIITLDSGMRVIELNDAAKTICGLGCEAKGKLLQALPDGCSGNCLPLVKQAIATREPAMLLRIECNRSARQPRVVTVTASPLFDQFHNFSGTVLVVRDETRITRIEKERGELSRFHRMIGKSPAMQRVYRLVEALTDLPSTVLICGESGTGKELVAEALHHDGVRAARPFVRVNCAALSDNLLESELFGHVKGAFTGALKERAGRFEKADGGTIFLDEIGDISPSLQVRLLRVLQEREFERVGDSTTIKVDVRVIAATNHDLAAKVHEGSFRADLYYRLKVVQIALPPLRERREDLALLVRHFIREFNRKLGKSVVGLSGPALETLHAHDWPGNVRELEHVLEHAFVVAAGQTITPADLPDDLASAVASTSPKGGKGKTAPDALLNALEKAGWNKSKAARLLGVDRRTIYRKMEEYDILERP